MTRKLGLSVLEKAVYTRLTTHASTNSYSTYGYVPKNVSFPFISMQGFSGIVSPMFDNRDTEAEANYFEIHVWSDYRGNKEALDMQNNIIQALTGSSLSITGYQTPFDLELDYSDIFIDDTDEDKIKRHGVMRFRVEMAPS